MRVSLIVATTVDGKITTTDDASSQFASEKDLEHLLAVRSQQDAILAGAKTILNDDPTFTSRLIYQEQRRKNGFSPNPIKCVVSGRGSILPSAKMFHHNNSPAIVFTTQQITADRYQALSKIADVFVVGTEKVDFCKIIQILADNYQVKSLLIEGGGEINASVFQAGIVNEVYITVCPKVAGGRDVPTAVEGNGFVLSDLVDLELISHRIVDSEVFLHYQVR